MNLNPAIVGREPASLPCCWLLAHCSGRQKGRDAGLDFVHFPVSWDRCTHHACTTVSVRHPSHTHSESCLCVSLCCAVLPKQPCMQHDAASTRLFVVAKQEALPDEDPSTSTRQSTVTLAVGRDLMAIPLLIAFTIHTSSVTTSKPTTLQSTRPSFRPCDSFYISRFLSATHTLADRGPPRSRPPAAQPRLQGANERKPLGVDRMA